MPFVYFLICRGRRNHDVRVLRLVPSVMEGAAVVTFAHHHDSESQAGTTCASTKRIVALSAQSRLLLTATSIGLATLLSVARTLEPSPLGRGTHTQLRLPSCAFVVLFGRPCPACGMTTAWAYVVRGELAAGFRANASGAISGLLALVIVPWWLGCAAAGRWLLWKPGNIAAVTTTVTLVLVALAQWGWRLLVG